MMKYIKSLIRKVKITKTFDDAGKYPTAQVTHNEVTTEAYRISVYGLSSHPVEGSLGFALAPSCRLDDPCAIFDDPINRFKELEPGEVQLGHYITRTSVKFTNDGNMTFDVAENGDLIVTVNGGDANIDVTGNVNLTCSGNLVADITGNTTLTSPTVTINGNLTVTGTVTGQTNVIGGANNVSLISHTHSNGNNGNPTGPPIV